MSDSNISNCFLAFWSLQADGKSNPPTVAFTRQTLAANNLHTDRAEDIPDTTAFRRACSNVKGEDQIVRHFTRKADNVHCAQFDQEIQDEGRLRRKFVCQYALIDNALSLIAGEGISEMQEAYEQAASVYTWADVSQVVQRILKNDGMGAYSPKKNGGVYFVPVKPEAADLLDRIERFAESLSVRFLKYSIPDTASQRAEIADAIVQSFFDEITVHAEAIAAYSEDTKLGILSNRRAAIQATNDSLNRMRQLCNGRYTECTERMRLLLIQIAALEQRITTKESERALQEQQTNALEGQRRIVGVAS